MNQPTDLDLDAIARREAHTFSWMVLHTDDQGGNMHQSSLNGVLLTVAERDALVTMARAYRTLMRRMHLLEDDPK